MSTSNLKHLPWALTFLRLLLAAAMIAAAIFDVAKLWFVVVLATAFWFDIIDGACARKLGVSTPELRRFDSRADVAFFLAALVSIWVTQAAVFYAYLPLFAGLLVLEAICQVANQIRFGCFTSTHTWLCKAWAIMLFFSVTRILYLGEAGWPIDLTIAFGVIAYADCLLVILLSRETPVDVPTWWHAWRMRRNEQPSATPRTEPDRGL